MIRQIARFTCLLALPAVCTLLPSQAAADVMLKAATANPTPKPEVRLRWTITEGWFPDGQAFNIYRTQNGMRKKLNSAPIKSMDAASVSSAPMGKTSELKTMLGTAKLRPAGMADKDLFRFNPRTPRPVSSKPVFDALNTQILSLKQVPGPALPPNDFQQKVRSNPIVDRYISSFKVANPQTQALSQVDQVRQARAKLIYGSMANQSVGRQLGLAFDDTTVENGGKYQYELRSVAANGTEAQQAAGTVEITVGADPQPPAPTGLAALQRDADTVSMRWDRLTQDQEAPFGLISYNVYRTVGAGQPALISPAPIVIGSILGTGGHVEPASFFSDINAPVGAVTYRLTMLDMFGRESPAASVAFTVDDWHTPTSVIHAQADLHQNRTVVAWTASEDTGVQYRIYRLDVEKPNAALELLTQAPIAGDPYNPNPVLHKRISVAHSESLAKFGVLSKAFASKTLVQITPNKPHASHQLQALKLPKAPVWLSYFDQNPPKDHYFKYIVTALYTRNNRDSGGTATTAVAIPLDTKPPVPGSMKNGFIRRAAEAPKQEHPVVLSMDNSVEDAQAALCSTLGAQVGATQRVIRDDHLKSFITDEKFRGKLILAINGQPQDTGGTVTLTWDPYPGTAPVTYRVYRANATGFLRPIASAVGSVNPNLIGVASTPGTLTLNSKLGGFSALTKKFDTRAVAPIITKPGVNRGYTDLWTSAIKLYQLDFAMVGEVKNRATYSETVTKSHAHYYIYRVVAVNRWGVASDPAELKVRVPSTLAPSVPSILAAFPSESGGVQVQMRLNPREEEVAKYHVLRKAVPVKHEFTSIIPAGTRDIIVPVITKSAAPAASLPKSFQIPVKAIGKTSAVMSGQSLVATGLVTDKVGSGAARFGILRNESAFSAMHRFTDGKLALSPEILALMDTVGYEDVGAADSTKVDANGILSFTDSSGSPQTEYAYRIVAEDADQQKSKASAILDAAAFKVKADPVTNLTPAMSGGGVKLTWGAPKDGVGYVVQRSSDAGAHFTQLCGIRKELTYTDFSAIVGRTYTYRVLAVDSSGNVSDPADKPFSVPAM